MYLNNVSLQALLFSFEQGEQESTKSFEELGNDSN